MIKPTPGVVYSFHFISGYENMNGIYKIVKLMTYDEYLEDNGDLVASFFVPCGKTEDDLNDDLTNVKSMEIMKLVSPNPLDTTVTIYAPLAYVETVPDHNVKQYIKLAAVCYIGYTDDPEILTFVQQNLKEQFKSALGIEPDPKFISVGETWMTETEYNEVLAGREDTVRRCINYFSEHRKKELEIIKLRSRIAALEERMLYQHSKIKELTNQLDQITAPGD